MQKLKRNWLVSLKLPWGIWRILIWALKISKIYNLLGCLWPKYIMFELKMYRGVMFDGTEDWCKTWRETDFYFQKWHEEFGKFWSEHLKISYICTLMGCLRTKYIYNVWVKKVQRSCVWWHWILMKNLKENWLLFSEMTWEIWEVFTRALESLKIGILMGIFNLK